MIWAIIGLIAGIAMSRGYHYYLERRMWAEVEKNIQMDYTVDQYYYTMKDMQNG